MSEQTFVCTPPPVESLLEEGIGLDFWPNDLLSRSDFLEQLAAQRSLLQQIRNIFAVLPLSCTLAEGVRQGIVFEFEAENLCLLLAKQLGSNEAQKRLALYLPFELLSPIVHGQASLQRASEQLHRAYRNAWESQLNQHEVRANYVDGDVLEPELLIGDHPRVVKAAHLIPGLLRVGHLTPDEALEYLRSARDPLLRKSLQEGCRVAIDLGLLETDSVTFTGYRTETIPAPVGMTKGRARWKAVVAEAETLQKKAKATADQLVRGRMVTDVLPDDMLAVAIEAIRIASLSNKNIFDRHKQWLEGIAKKATGSSVRDGLNKLYAHLYVVDIAGDEDLAVVGVTTPQLSGCFYKNRHTLQPSVSEVTSMCIETSQHERLRKLVYPTALIFGSQIKGYGLTEADCDLAVFVRPGVSRDERQYLETELARIYNHKRFDGKVTLFWLTESDDHLKIINWPKPEYSDGEASWIHVLFGALWFGEEATIQQLHRQLLSTYFFAPDTTLENKPVYERWLEEVERDALQYRLLHKGFERYYPIQSSFDTEHSKDIDGHTAFYDPRYRRIATELYVRRVFLPQLSKL